MMSGDTSVNNHVLIAGSTTVLVTLIYYVFFLKRNRDDEAPTAPVGIMETRHKISGKTAPQFVLQMVKETGSWIYRLNIPAPVGLYIIGDYKVQREILLDSTTDKNKMYSSFTWISGCSNIFTRSAKDPLWKLSRKGCSPAFSSIEVKRMKEICIKHLNKWITERLENYIVNDQSFNPCKEMTRLAFASIMESAFEFIDYTDEDYEEFIQNSDTAYREFTFKQKVNPLRGLIGIRSLIPETRKAIQSCKAMQAFARKILTTYRSNPNKSTQNTLIKLIEANDDLDDTLKVGEILTFITAGYDTTGYSLGNALVLLAKYPDIANKARESLAEGANMSVNNDNITCTDYIRYVIAESSRLLPMAAMGSARELGRDFILENGIRIPKGAQTFLSLYVSHRNPNVFPDPDTFNPDRWSNPTSEMNDSLLTFSIGNRNCIGQSLAITELQSILPRILHNYTLELIDEGELDYFLTLKYSGSQIKAKKLIT